MRGLLGTLRHGSLADTIAACLPAEERRRYMHRLPHHGGGGGGRHQGHSVQGGGSGGSGSRDGGVSPSERAERTMRRMGLPATFTEASGRIKGAAALD
jgi:hypothetical protein